MAAVPRPAAVILRQRSPWQSQGFPTKELCTCRQHKEEGCPILARSLRRGGSIETCQPAGEHHACSTTLCHPERRKIVRSRTILRSRGTQCLPIVAKDRREFSVGICPGECAAGCLSGAKAGSREPRDLSTPRVAHPTSCSSTSGWESCRPPEAAESLAKPRTPNEASMHFFADTTRNEGCPIFRALCERWERRMV